jgi:hypothetical protein
MPKVQIQDDAKARETASIPTNRANPPTKGKPIGMPKPLQMFVSILRITRLRRINDRGNCGQSAARVHLNEWTLKTLSPNFPNAAITNRRWRAVQRLA